MKSQLVKWGNSTAVRIPRDILQKSGLQEGDFLEFGAKKGAIIAKVVKRRFNLGDLVDGIHPENRHDAMDGGEPEGNENW